QARGRHLVVHGGGADLDRLALLPDSRQPRNPRDVDQDARLAEAQLHQRHQAVAAGDEFSGAAGGAEFREGVVERRRAHVIERRRNHARPPWMIRHSFSGRSIISTCLTPNSLSASTTADTTLGLEPSVPASPTPLAPSGLTGRGVTGAWSPKRGKATARGTAWSLNERVTSWPWRGWTSPSFTAWPMPWATPP